MTADGKLGNKPSDTPVLKDMVATPSPLNEDSRNAQARLGKVQTSREHREAGIRSAHTYSHLCIRERDNPYKKLTNFGNSITSSEPRSYQVLRNSWPLSSKIS